MDFETIRNMVHRLMNKTAVVDVHTHLYSEAFGDLLLVLLGEFYGNLIYGMYSYGTNENNINVGIGYPF